MQLRKATRKKAKIRLGLSAVSGGGKTYSAILIAKGLCGDLSKVAVIDTENGSADLYAHLGDYNVLPLTAPFTPERYIEAIRSCEKAGMEVIVVDSISHEWDGKGGCLEIVEQLGGKYQDWAKVTPRHQAFLEAILHSSSHVITTVRRKQD
ncbi:MAG TPA: AAA family ATPase [Flavisolibacter sp.]|nr:AAA family ATPase [Flavisolibacter sp.]